MLRVFIYTLLVSILLGCSPGKECGSVNISNLDSREISRQFLNFSIKKEYENAKCVLDEMQERRPSIDYGWQYAEVFSGLGQNERALQEFSRAIEQDPHFYTGYLQVAVGFNQNGEVEAARQVLRKAVAAMDSAGAPKVCSYSPVQEEIFLLAAELSTDKSEKVRLLRKGVKHVALSEEIWDELKRATEGKSSIANPCQ